MQADLVFHRQFWALLHCLTTQERNSPTGNEKAALHKAQALSARHFAEAVTTCPNSTVLAFLAKQAVLAQQTAPGAESTLCTSSAHAALERRSDPVASLHFAQDRSQACS